MAVALKRENPDRTGAQVRRILATQMGWAPGERTLQRWFADDPQIADLLAAGASGAGVRAVRGRCGPNELWTGDALHGPHVGGRKTYLFAFLDDHSRAIMGHRFGFAEDTVRLAAALRPALGSRGVPERDLRRLCRPGGYADLDEDRLLSGGDRADDVGIIRGLRGRRAGCRVRGSGPVLCWVGSCARSLVPSGTCRRAGRRSWW